MEIIGAGVEGGQELIGEIQDYMSGAPDIPDIPVTSPSVSARKSKGGSRSSRRKGRSKSRRYRRKRSVRKTRRY